MILVGANGCSSLYHITSGIGMPPTTQESVSDLFNPIVTSLRDSVNVGGSFLTGFEIFALDGSDGLLGPISLTAVTRNLISVSFLSSVNLYVVSVIFVTFFHVFSVIS